MKRMIAFMLSLAMILTGCTQSQSAQQDQPQPGGIESDITAETSSDIIVWKDDIPQYDSMDDAALLSHIEDLVYRETVCSLNSEEYFVENVSAVYISKEYLDEVAFNSQSNIYFGYTLAELDELFQGTRYVFTLGEDGQTTVQELQEIEDTSAETMLQNVAIGTGVILVCVTVSAVASIAGASAISVIFAASAKTGAIMALSAGGFGAISAGIVREIQTGDFEETIGAAAFAGTEGFKWGAISGAIIGGTQEAFALKAATKNGLTMKQAAIIQKESGYPMDIISQFHSIDEYYVYKEAGLKPAMINGQIALVQDIDLDYISPLPDGTEASNLVRMRNGYAPVDPVTGKEYHLHHIGQKSDGTLAVLTRFQHLGNSKILNIAGKESEINRSAFDKTRKDFWKAVARSLEGI